MKNLLMKMKKEEGYIGVETMVIAGLVVAAGFVAMNAVLGDLKGSADAAVTEIDASSASPFSLPALP